MIPPPAAGDAALRVFSAVPSIRCHVGVARAGAQPASRLGAGPATPLAWQQQVGG